MILVYLAAKLLLAIRGPALTRLQDENAAWNIPRDLRHCPAGSAVLDLKQMNRISTSAVAITLQSGSWASATMNAATDSKGILSAGRYGIRPKQLRGKIQ